MPFVTGSRLESITFVLEGFELLFDFVLELGFGLLFKFVPEGLANNVILICAGAWKDSNCYFNLFWMV